MTSKTNCAHHCAASARHCADNQHEVQDELRAPLRSTPAQVSATISAHPCAVTAAGLQDEAHDKPMDHEPHNHEQQHDKPEELQQHHHELAQRLRNVTASPACSTQGSPLLHPPPFV